MPGAPSPDGPRARSRRAAGSRSGILLALAVLCLGLNLRTLFASLPPLLEEVRDDLDLSATASGLLTTGPILCLGLLAPLAPRLGRRMALERVLWLGLAATAAGMALRGLHGVAWLFAGTLVAGAGVALAQVALPVVIRFRHPERMGALTGVFSMSLTLSGTLAAALSVPLAHALGGWPAALAAWAAPAAVVALAWTLPALRAHEHAGGEEPHRPWRAPLGWWLGGFFGIQSSAFFATLAWLPSMLQDNGVSERDAGLLLALGTLTSIPPAFLLPVLAARLPDQRALLAATVGAAAAGIVGLTVAADAAVAWVVLIGAGQGAALGLGLMLPVLRASDHRTAGPLMGMTLSIGYTTAAAGPWLLGAVHDLTHEWTVPLLVLLAITAAELPLGLVGARGRPGSLTRAA